jgi:hypothetical protein
LKGLKNLFGEGLVGGPEMEAAYAPQSPFGLPEAKKGRFVSRKALEKQRKKSKQARQARKKAKKR